jgi:hypothetical protein
VLGAVPFGLLAGGCSEEDDYANEPRPPTPIVVSASVSPERISVSPRQFGAGPVTLIVTNQTDSAQEISLETDEIGGGAPGIEQRSGPINPGDTASLKADLRPGSYKVGVSGGGGSASLRVGARARPRRTSSSSRRPTGPRRGRRATKSAASPPRKRAKDRTPWPLICLMSPPSTPSPGELPGDDGRVGHPQEREGEPLDAFQVEEIEVPEPGAFEVIVRVMAAGVNFNNVWAALGKPVSVFGYGDHPEFGHHIGGSDASGVVWKVGPGVTRWKAGDEVVVHCNQTSYEDPEVHGLDPMAAPSQKIWGYETTWGSFAQFTKVQAQQLLPKPKHLAWEEAASYGLTYFTAYRMLMNRRSCSPATRSSSGAPPAASASSPCSCASSPAPTASASSPATRRASSSRSSARSATSTATSSRA